MFRQSFFASELFSFQGSVATTTSFLAFADFFPFASAFASAFACAACCLPNCEAHDVSEAIKIGRAHV